MMFSDEEIRKYWSGRLKVWREELLQELSLEGEQKEYLRTVGLPCGLDWTLSFEPPQAQLRRPESFPELVEIGSDDMVPICLDERSGEIVCLEPGNSLRFMSSGIRNLGETLIIYQEYRDKVRSMPEEDVDAFIEEIEERMRTSDSRALAIPESYWSVVIEQMKDGLL